MKTIIKPIAVLMAMTIFAGCEAFLDTESFTDRNTGNFPASEQDALQLVTGIYNTLNSGVYEPGSSYWMTAMLASDECYGGGGQDDYDTQASDHLLVSDENIHSDYWNYYYSGIARANMAIANLDKVEDEALRNQGFGKDMMEDVHALAAAFRCTDLQLGVYPQNDDAVGFFQKCGFTIRSIEMQRKV